MGKNKPWVIKSFKHDGQPHRMWMENWLVPNKIIAAEQTGEAWVLVNNHTRVKEKNGNIWRSHAPAVVFLIAGKWYNIVGFPSDGGVRYYCNMASPPYQYGNIITYIDYDLDVLLSVNGRLQVVDRDEFEQHTLKYKYPAEVIEYVEQARAEILEMAAQRQWPFHDAVVYDCYRWYKQHHKGGRPLEHKNQSTAKGRGAWSR